MKKILSLLLTAALSLTLLAACGQTPAEEPAESEDTQAAETAETPAEGSETASAGDLETIVITEDVRGYHWAPAYLAETLGYFAEEGLHADFQTIRGADSTAPVMNGEALFCLKGIETALMLNQAGQGCKVVLSATQKFPYCLMGASEEYSTLESLKGQTVGGGLSATSGPMAFIRACLASANLVPDQDVTCMNLASAGYPASLEAGEAQAVVSTNPWSLKTLQDLGCVTIVEGTDDAVIENIIGSASYELFTVVTSDKNIAEQGETIQKAVNAMAKALQWMETASPEEIAENLAPLFESSPEELLFDATYDKDHEMANYTGYHSDSGYQAGIRLCQLGGGIPEDYSPDASEIFDESFLDAAWEKLGA